MTIIPNPQYVEYTENKYLECALNSYDDLLKAVTFEEDDRLKSEEYKISVKENQIKITASCGKGKFYALSTLEQIYATSEKIPQMEIHDYPNLEVRGYMLDISRGKLPKLCELKKLVEIISRLKINQLQLYMDNFVYGYHSFPNYWKPEDVLSESDIKELDAFCKEHYMELVPNQNSFGHMENWLKKDELKSLAIKTDSKQTTLNPLEPKSLELVDKIYSDIDRAFSSDKLNIGMDEPFELGMGQTKEACEKYGNGKVYTDYLLKVIDIADKHGKKPMFWADIVFKYEEEIKRLPDDVIVAEWGYEANHPFERHCKLLKDLGIEFYICPGSSMWGSFTGRTDNMIENLVSANLTAYEYNAKGMLLTEWGDNGNPQFPAMTYFPLVLGASLSWKWIGSNNEFNVPVKNKLINECLEYINRNIFKVQNNINLARVAYDMGNYYLLENERRFNGTLLSNYLDGFAKRSDIDPKAAKRVTAYLTELISEAEKADADILCKREIIACAAVALLIARSILGEDVTNDKEKYIKEFTSLWNVRNYKTGIEIFIRLLEKI